MLAMAITKTGHSHRRLDAQPIRHNRDHQTHQTEQDALTADTAIRANQRHADARTRRVKQRTRYHSHGFVAVRRTEIDDCAGPGIGDRCGEVA